MDNIILPQRRQTYDRKLNIPVRISEKHRNELDNLKRVWRLRSMDAVIEKLIATHRHEQIGVLGIKVEEEAVDE